MIDFEKNVSADDVAHGCLASALVMVLVMILLSLIFTEWLELLTADTERAIQVAVWLAAVGIGGYVSSRRSIHSGVRTALWVGTVATLFIMIRLPEPVEGGDWMDQFRALFQGPRQHWRHLVGLALTIPSALLGGLIAQRKNPRPEMPSH